MDKGITLNQFIGELLKLAVEHGNDEISSIGSSSGKIAGMTSPFCFNFKGHDATEFVPAYSHDVKPLAAAHEVPARDDSGELRHVWMRVGMTLAITPEEEKTIFEGDYSVGKEAVMRVIESGRASVDGETYIPEECIRDFDEEYGTNYQQRDEECAWTMDGDMVYQKEFTAPCKVGDIIFEIRADGQGISHIHEAEVLEVSTQRVWVDSNYYDYDDIGRSVFLSLEEAEAALASPEYLAARVNAVMRYNISDNAKKELLVAGFAAGQEYFERDTERFIKLTAKGPFDVWTFDVFDKNKELGYSTAETAGRLALDMLAGYIVPAALAEERSWKFFEVFIGNEYAVCIRGEREPSKDEILEYLKADVEKHGFVAADIKHVAEISKDDAYTLYNMEYTLSLPFATFNGKGSRVDGKSVGELINDASRRSSIGKADGPAGARDSKHETREGLSSR